MSAPASTRARLLLLAEATLLAVTLAAVVGLGGLFADGSFVPEVAVTAVAGHVIAAACRRRRVPPFLTLLVALVAGTLVLTWLHLPETTTAGLPTTETLDLLRAQLDEAWQTFGEIVAPAPVLPGFVLAASIGVWFVAFAADTAAFRAQAMVEAVVPAGTVFVFGGALGRGEHRVLVASAFLAAVLGHWLAQRALTSASAPTWLSSASGGGAGPLLRLGVLLGGAGVLAAAVIGPNLPGADAKAVIPWRATDRDQPDSRVTISPLVDIRTRLVEQGDLEVFRVESAVRSYWRLTSLERFDGRIWSSNRQYRPAEGRLGSEVDVDDDDAIVSRQRFTIGGLSSIWLPAAFRPIGVSGTEARFDPDSGSLLTEQDTAQGLTYTVESAIPDLDAARLGAVPSRGPGEAGEEYLLLPVDFSPRVRQLAGEVVAGAASPFETARALQDFLRSDAFTYDLEVAPGHGGDDLERFLFDTRRGYCEQFAGAFAAMARAVGLPARVAVGFTPGEPDPATGAFVVRGFNGHAWPEVHLDGVGWVAFEPTPGRGIPGAEGYTDVPEQQAAAEDPAGTATTIAPTTTTVAGGVGPSTTVAPQEVPTEVPPAIGEAPSPWPRRLLVALGLVVALPVLWASLLAVLRVLRRRRRRAAATTPAARVLVAWDEVGEALARAGTAPEPSETPSEFAGRAAAARPSVDARLLDGLAGLTTSAAYGPAAVPEEVADRALEVADELSAAADALVEPRDRLRLLLDPRPLLPERAARVDVREPV